MTDSINSIVRRNISLILNAITMILLLVAVIFIIINRQSQLVSSGDYCALKAAFGLYIVAVCAHMMMLILDCLTIILSTRTQGTCNYESYHTKVKLHLISALAIFIGVMVESSDSTKEWQFYICLIAAFLSSYNAIMWCVKGKRRSVKAKAFNAEETIQQKSAANAACFKASIIDENETAGHFQDDNCFEELIVESNDKGKTHLDVAEEERIVQSQENTDKPSNEKTSKSTVDSLTEGAKGFAVKIQENARVEALASKAGEKTKEKVDKVKGKAIKKAKGKAVKTALKLL